MENITETETEIGMTASEMLDRLEEMKVFEFGYIDI